VVGFQALVVLLGVEGSDAAALCSFRRRREAEAEAETADNAKRLPRPMHSTVQTCPRIIQKCDAALQVRFEAFTSRFAIQK
jgi:hypothetical protein